MVSNTRWDMLAFLASFSCSSHWLVDYGLLQNDVPAELQAGQVLDFGVGDGTIPASGAKDRFDPLHTQRIVFGWATEMASSIILW